MRISIFTLFLAGSICGCSSAGGPDSALAAQLGYQGCKISKPVSMLEIMSRDMSGGNEAGRAHPDFDALIAKHRTGDQVYHVDCKRLDPSRIVIGTSQYVLVRDGAVIAHATETASE